MYFLHISSVLVQNSSRDSHRHCFFFKCLSTQCLRQDLKKTKTLQKSKKTKTNSVRAIGRKVQNTSTRIFPCFLSDIKNNTVRLPLVTTSDILSRDSREDYYQVHCENAAIQTKAKKFILCSFSLTPDNTPYK